MSNLLSISFSYRLGLGFHALNNEGADGSNLMQPRQIDCGETTYDGISGEIIRRHILENFVSQCRIHEIPMYPLSEGLHPDRGPIGIRVAAMELGKKELTNEVLHPSVRQAICRCSVLDVGGFLAAWKDQGVQEKGYIAESSYINEHCAPNQGVESIKRDSCFDVAWLISQEPQDYTVTQHSAFRDTTSLNSRYAQTMRSNIYGGIIRADLHRIGTDDYWYLQKGKQRLAISQEEQKKRQKALVQAIGDFIASPNGAKVSAWAPHVFLVEGAILLSSRRTAPFTSPIKVDLSNEEKPVQFNSGYLKAIEDLKNDKDTWVWTFSDARELIKSVTQIISKLESF